ncbi:MAG: DUF929 family protein [Acidimicrobiales bacterium]
MSAVQAGGGNRGSGQDPGAGSRNPKPGSGPPKGAVGKSTAGGKSTAVDKSAAGRGTAARGGGGPKGAGRRPSTPVAAKAPGRFSPSTIAFASIAVVVVIVVALVVIKVTGGSTTSATGSGPVTTPAPAALVSQVTDLRSSVAQSVGLPSSVTAPTVAKGQQPLTIGGKPGALFIGGEFCPYCAAERWAIIMAFSRFGTFSGLQETTSSPWDSFPSTATFSFHSATYSSNLISFDPVEEVGNDTTGPGTRSILQKLTPFQSNLWAKYSAKFGVTQGFPFLDIDNKVFALGPSYSPQILSGLDQSAIAAKLSNPADPVTQAIVGSANYLTAAICSITNQQPGPVCSAPVVVQATKALGLG